MDFSELKMNKNICRALREVGYEQPTPIQCKAIPPVLEGRDLMGCAQTGTGKTCAFAAPVIQRLCAKRNKNASVRALILTPTRELALQIYENVCQYARYTPCTSAVIFGGVSQIPQVESIERGAEILIATPGRLWDLMGQGIVTLGKVETFVLDEADRMLDMGFFPDVKRIIKYLPQKRQTLLFSATIPPEISALADSLLHNPARIAITPSARPVEKICQKVYFVEKAEKRELLADVIRQNNVRQTLVFTRTKHGADRVARELNRAGIKSKAIHGDKSQNQRQNALNDFKACKVSVLVATDIAARGIDISELPLVINYELPNIPETYVHRIGRTGRAGMEGTAVSFCDTSERPYLADIEKLTGKRIPVAGEIPHKGKEREMKAKPETLTRTHINHTRRPAAQMKSTGVAIPQRSMKSRRTTQTGQGEQPSLQAVHKVSAQRNLTHNSVNTKKRRSSSRAHSEIYEPRVDAHTPSRSYALSEEAAARIRKKVEAALALRAAQAAKMPAAINKNVESQRRGRRTVRKP